MTSPDGPRGDLGAPSSGVVNMDSQREPCFRPMPGNERQVCRP
jgi:hypothetical protein